MQSEDQRNDGGTRLSRSPLVDLSATPGAFPVSPTLSWSPPSQSQPFDDAPTEPDAFYRSYDTTSQASGHPFDVEPLRDPYDTKMTSPQSRIPRNVNGVLPKNSAIANANPSRANPRSASGPTALNTTNVNGIKPRSASSNAPRVASGSIRDRIRQIEQAHTTSPNSASRYGRSNGPSASQGPPSKSGVTEQQKENQHTSTKPSTLQKRPPNPHSPPTTRKVISKQPPDSKANSQRSNNGRQPLFGEVITVNTNGVGHGIPSNYAKRSASEGNIQSPTASAQSSRSQSRLDTPISAHSARPTDTLGSPQHFRSQSESAASPIPEQGEEAVNDRSSKFQLPARAFGQSSRPPASRTPGKVRRYSASSDHLPSVPKKAPSPTLRPTTPPNTSTAKRYVRTPTRTPNGSHSVNAVIKELPVKSTPPPSLRSSKPRVPVSAASTAASRAKQNERTSAKSSRSTSPAPPTSKERPPRTKGMLRAAEEARQKSRSRNRIVNYAATDSSGSLSRTTSFEAYLDRGSEMEGDTAPRLGLAIDTTADPALTEPESGFTEIDDDSPILGRTVYQPVNAGQDHDRIPAQTIAHEPRLLSPILASPSLSEARDAEQDVASGSEPAAPSSSQENLLQQVLRMRGSDLSNGAENRKFSDLFSNADEGTIQVVLGATPVLESSAAEQWTHGPTQPIEFTTPRAEELNDALGHTPGSFNQDDSVSAILGPKSSQGTSSASTSTPNARQHQFTLDSEAREEINEILMFYNSHLVTREMGFEFQQQVATISPEIAQSEAWASPKETRMFLRRVLDSNAPSEIPAPIELPQEVAVPEFLSPRSEPTPPSARSITYPYEGTPEGDDWQPGFATVHLGPEVPAKDMVDSPSAQQIYRQDSATSAPGDLQQEYWSAVDSRGMVTHKPAPPPKDSAHGSFSGLGLNLSPVDGSAQGLGLGFGANTERSYSVPAVPAHSPPPPPLPPQPASARDYSITYPPPLPFASPPPLPRSPGAQIRVTHVSSYANPLVESPTAPTGKRRVDRVSADSTHATQTTRLSIEAAAQYPGTIKHRRSYSANTTITKDASSGRPSLEPSTTASSTTVVDSGVSAQTKRLNTRKNIIKELVDTEYSYNQDMVILEDIYKGTAAPILNKEDMKTLFGNLDAVRSLSTKFLDALKKAAAPVYTLPKSSRWNYKRGSFSTSMSGLNDSFDKSTEDLSEDDRDAKDRETRIGKVFSEYLPDLERTYGDYLRNRNRANQRFAELQKEDSVKLWLNECAESAKDLTSHPTLDSFLLKPFQRITRYPLLLSSLQGVTPQDHPDRQDVDIAYDSVMHATSTINSRQKREDIVQQVMLGQTAQSKDRQKGGLGKLMKPKTGKVQQHLGFVNYVEDQEYDAIAQRFGGHFFQLQIVMRDIEKYLDDVTDYVAWFTRFSENMSEYLDTSYASNHEMEARWNTFGQTAKSIQQNLLDTHRKEVRRIVIEPIVTLWKQHEGPQRMMQKRKKRVPEYARYKDMLEKKMKPDKRMEQQAEEFTAINETLKEELPKLYTLTKLLIESCLCRFVNIQAKWQGAWVKTMQKVLSEAATPDMDLDMIMRDCTANFEEVRCETEQLALCNGQARLGLSQFLSPTTTFSEDTRSTHKRPSTNHSRSENNFSFSSPNTTNRLSGGHSPLAGAFPTPAEQYQANRMRATSAATSRSPATPQKTTYTPPQSAFPSRPATAAAHHNDLSPNVTWPSNEHQYNQRPRSSSNYLVPDPGFTALNSPTRVSPNFAAEVEAERRYRERVLQEQAAYQDIAAREWYTNGSQQDRPQRPRSKVFSSAMSDPAEAIPPSPAEDEEEEINVMFLAASLFEFRIDPNRTEAGYPYLRYAPGEVFDVVGVKGELWLARNQDDSSRTVGWIWEKHFARILDA